jgi:hypothetical protein
LSSESHHKIAFKQTWKPLSMADVEEVIYDKVGRTPQILNEK